MGERLKHTNKIKIKIIPTSGSSRLLTNLFDYDPGEGPANVVMGDEADLGGRVPVTVTENRSRRPTVTVSADTTDEKYLKRLERDKIQFRMIVIDETSDSVRVQHTCSECHIEKALAKTVRDTKTMAFTVLTPEFKEDEI
ncbi:hypothetical protein [Fusobacterium mortiferum]|uniref:Phage tail protein n=1 Tax=Fusobacterium mortiferum TaxID=850 RepID=A0ABS2G6D8_FUSMR|nr:hypothetical protein [Fusobacterium mortiferum]MBM6876274.1 hypothetical protein [Fusobacterium mortiferum]